MLKVKKVSSNRVDLKISGKIDSDEMKAMLPELFSATKDMEHGLLMYRIEKLEMPALGAIGVELANLPDLFRLIHKIDKAAVVCDQEWIQTIAEIEGKLFPGLEIKAFDSDEEDEALEWLIA
ncbi:MAG: hypothetical protein DHS20C12_21210 [Pseudohongiella sp.]|nr:MAG: hypothetical protein DHS20C12_21210 [Pseudohongiella sp.]